MSPKLAVQQLKDRGPEAIRHVVAEHDTVAQAHVLEYIGAMYALGPCLAYQSCENKEV